MSDGMTYFGSGKPVRNVDGALVTTRDGVSRDADAAAIAEALQGFTPVGSPVTNADLSSAYALSFPAGATKAIVQFYGKNVRAGLGTNPTSNTGFQITPEDGRWLFSAAQNPRFIQEEATATAYIQYGA